MTKQIMLTLSDEVYEQFLQMAEAEQRSIADVIVDVIAPVSPIFSVDPRRPAMLQEQAAYKTMHADLLRNFEGQFVAVHQGQVIDHDTDELALSQRVRLRLPDAVILIRQVLPQMERVLHFRSPRLVRE